MFFGIHKQLCPYFLNLYYSISDFFCQYFLQHDTCGRSFDKSIITLTFSGIYVIIIVEFNSSENRKVWSGIGMTRREQAGHILYQCGLLEELKAYGCPHIIGSYRMDMMAWNDLDIDVENDKMSLDKLYTLSDYIIKTFHPVWYEAKEEQTDDDKTVWFHGFETKVEGQLWNIDIWFFDKDTIEKAERYCDSVARQVSDMPDLKRSIISIKQELIARGLYSFEQYTSIDVYNAVLDKRITNIDDFLAVCRKRRD